MDLAGAAKEGKIDVVQYLIANGADVNRSGEGGRNALIWASEKGHMDVLNLLIESAADVDSVDQSGTTALMCASSFGHSEIVEVLAKASADVNRSNKTGTTALMSAATSQSNKGRHQSIIRTLLAADADVAMSDKSGRSAFIHAARQGNKEVASLLLIANAEVNATDKDDWTALMWAASRGQNEVVKVLLLGKADANVSDQNGDTALMKAAELGYADVVESLISFSDVNKCNSANNTPLMLAVHHPDTTKILIQCEADLNKVDWTGNTALMIAVITGSLDTATHLLSASADVSFINKDNNTVFDEAMRLDDNPLEMIEALQNRFMFPEPLFVPFFKLSNIVTLTEKENRVVYKAVLEIGDTCDGPATIPVICKASKLSGFSNEWYEYQVIQNLPYHPNVLGLLAMCNGFSFQHVTSTDQFKSAKEMEEKIEANGGTTKITAMLFVIKEGGSLRKHLKQRAESLSLSRMAMFGVDIATSIAHLHECGYKNNDIATRNFKLTDIEDEKDPGQAQSLVLTHLGLTRATNYQNNNPGSTKHPIRWCAPEVLISLGTYTTKQSDIWMLGVTLWELICTPYLTPFHQVPPSDILKHLQNGKHLYFPPNCAQEWKNIVISCCQLDPRMRPTARDIAKDVRKLQTHRSRNGSAAHNSYEKKRRRSSAVAGAIPPNVIHDDYEHEPHYLSHNEMLAANDESGIHLSDEWNALCEKYKPSEMFNKTGSQIEALMWQVEEMRKENETLRQQIEKLEADADTSAANGPKEQPPNLETKKGWLRRLRKRKKEKRDGPH